MDVGCHEGARLIRRAQLRTDSGIHASLGRKEVSAGHVWSAPHARRSTIASLRSGAFGGRREGERCRLSVCGRFLNSANAPRSSGSLSRAQVEGGRPTLAACRWTVIKASVGAADGDRWRMSVERLRKDRAVRPDGLLSAMGKTKVTYSQAPLVEWRSVAPL